MSLNLGPTLSTNGQEGPRTVCPHQGVSGELVALQLLLTVSTRQTHTATVAPVRQQP